MVNRLGKYSVNALSEYSDDALTHIKSVRLNQYSDDTLTHIHFFASTAIQLMLYLYSVNAFIRTGIQLTA